MFRKVFVVGSGMSNVGRFYERPLRDLAGEALFKAVDDARNVMPEFIVVSNMLSSQAEQENLASLIADYCGLRSTSGFKVEAACGSGGAALVAGYALISSGLADVVAVVGVEKLSERTTPEVARGLAYAADADFEIPYGISFSGLNALIMRYYMSKYNVRRDDMSSWPVLMHENGYYNPYAHLKMKITAEDVVKSPIIADPIRLLDSCPMSDGAAAVILASEDVAKKYNDTPVMIAGVGNALDSTDISSRFELDSFLASRLSAERAFKTAKLSPKDVDVVELHDAYSINGVITLEDVGFAPKGMGAKLIAEGRFRPGDKPSINPSGGLKSRGHPVGATGVYQVCEVVMQLRGDFPGVKVGGEVGLTQNIGGVGSNITTLILRR